MRALQKAVAEELELPPSVMAIFDQQDEEDDFSGIDEGSRGVIEDIRTEIFIKLASSRFVVIFHNGSNEYIDLYECGVPVISVLSIKCRLHDRLALVEHKKGLLPDDIGMVLSEATSCFILPDYNYRYLMILATIPDCIFQHSHSSKLRVLHLERCSFSFESPPFLCCSKLRFLQLYSCTNILSDKHPSHNEDMSCFHKLWVLHLWHTNWYQLLSEEMMNFMADLRELRVELVKGWSIRDLRGKFPSLVKVQVQEYLFYKEYHLPDLSSAHFLKTVILDSCVELEQVVPGVLPPMLESFTFRNYIDYSAKISSISFRGFSQLKSILLIGDLGKLQELDLSGTTVKIFDLRKVSAPNLKRLILLGCEKLCAILWPEKYKMTQVLEVLHINTIRSTSAAQANREEKTRDPIAAAGSSTIHVATAAELGISRHASFDFKWYISPRDTRILRSLEPVKNIEHSHVYMEMVSSPTSAATVADSEIAQAIWSLCKPDNYSYASDAFFQTDLQAGADNEGAISWMWDCPAIPTPTAQDLLIHVLPLSESVDALPCLDTLEIVCCGDLREVFALDPKQKEQKVIQFPKLRRIHLYELPSLRRICGSKMSTPNLKNVKIRGCWSLRCLPSVSGNNEKMPTVNCEKEWWDNLEWDGVEANHHSSLYENSHSSYYKTQLPRGTVLR
ncbi:hypothetical protein ZWY2020_015598 [Hordeum vulgare]|nr:hypothetical protein ZWY2020_015598 [Hordeum vulgare]